MTTPTPSPDVRRNNLDEIKSVWLQQCGSCDYGIGYSCTCPAGDYRPVMMNLVDEVEALRAGLAAASRQIAEEIAEAISDNVRNEDWSRRGTMAETASYPGRQQLHQALHELGVRIPNLPVDGCHCNLLTEVIFDALKLCTECGRALCPECKLCPLCAGDGHDEGCSRQGDEYTPEQHAAIFGEGGKPA